MPNDFYFWLSSNITTGYIKQMILLVYTLNFTELDTFYFKKDSKFIVSSSPKHVQLSM